MSYQFKNISVLVVDSQPAIVELIRDVLIMFGVKNVKSYTDGVHAMKALETMTPDLMIIDWDLETMSGIEFTRSVRHDPKSSYVPIIFMTALSSSKRVEEARDSGITEFLRKPFTAEALYKRIEAIVEKPRAFVHSDNFIGPDRRRKSLPDYKGPDRRDQWAVDIDMV